MLSCNRLRFAAWVTENPVPCWKGKLVFILMDFRACSEPAWKISVLLVSHSLCAFVVICRHSETEFVLFSYTSTPGGYLLLDSQFSFNVLLNQFCPRTVEAISYRSGIYSHSDFLTKVCSFGFCLLVLVFFSIFLNISPHTTVHFLYFLRIVLHTHDDNLWTAVYGCKEWLMGIWGCKRWTGEYLNTHPLLSGCLLCPR